MRHLLSKNSLSPKQKGLQSFQLPDHFLSILGFIANFHKLPLVNVTNLSLGSCGVLVTMIVAGQIYMAWFSYCLYSFLVKLGVLSICSLTRINVKVHNLFSITMSQCLCKSQLILVLTPVNCSACEVIHGIVEARHNQLIGNPQNC